MARKFSSNKAHADAWAQIYGIASAKRILRQIGLASHPCCRATAQHQWSTAAQHQPRQPIGVQARCRAAPSVLGSPSKSRLADSSKCHARDRLPAARLPDADQRCHPDKHNPRAAAARQGVAGEHPRQHRDRHRVVPGNQRADIAIAEVCAPPMAANPKNSAARHGCDIRAQAVRAQRFSIASALGQEEAKKYTVPEFAERTANATSHMGQRAPRWAATGRQREPRPDQHGHASRSRG